MEIKDTNGYDLEVKHYVYFSRSYGRSDSRILFGRIVKIFNDSGYVKVVECDFRTSLPTETYHLLKYPSHQCTRL